MQGQLINIEREQLDHQRARLEQIITSEEVSPKLKSDLRRLLDDVSLRMWELQQPGAKAPQYAQH